MDYLVEFGLEEMPASVCGSIHSQLEKFLVPNLMKSKCLSADTINIYVTPRRIAIILKNIDICNDEKYIIGPKVSESITGDRINEVGKAFALKNNTSLRKLKKVKINRCDYLCIQKDVKNMLSKILEDFSISIISQIQLSKKMNWGISGVEFIRPIRWITTVLDTVPVSFTFAGVTASTLSYCSRFFGNNKIRVKTPSDYCYLLKQYGVIVNVEERKNMILKQIHQKEASKKIKVNVSEKLLNEIVYLVEYPTVIIGEFDKKYLQIPEEIISEVLYHHQKTFTVSKNGKITNLFISVVNQNMDSITDITKGWEKVIDARLSDALFYYLRDKTISINLFNERIKNIIVHEKIGSLWDIKESMLSNLPVIDNLISLSSEDMDILKEAIKIAFFDAGSDIGKEFPSLLGVIGSIYAKERKVKDDIAKAIKAMYTPRFDGDKVSNKPIEYSMAFLYKLTLLSGYLNAGLEIKGNYDPFGIRRLVISIIQIVLSNKLNISINDIINTKSLGKDLFENNVKDYAKDLFIGRIESMFKELNVSKNIVTRLIENLGEISLYDLFDDIKLFDKLEKKNEKWFSDLKDVIKRVRNVVWQFEKKNNVPDKINSIDKEKTKLLSSEIKDLDQSINNSNFDYLNKLQMCAKITDKINKYFEDVMVCDEDVNIAIQNIFTLKQFLKIVDKLGL